MAPPRRALAQTLLALAAVTVLAGGVRLWHIDTLPPGNWYDEAHKSLIADTILHGEQAPIYVTDVQGLEAGYFWLLAGWFWLTGPSLHGSRVLTALLGTATVPITYWAVAELYRELRHARLLALASAAWLSCLLWHVHWSRLGMETITVPLFAVALLGAMAEAWRHPSPAAFAVAGVVLGLSQYTNPGARLLPIQALVTFFILARGPWRKRLTLGAVFCLAAAVVYLPLGLFFIRHPEWFFNRIAATSAGARAGGLPAYVSNAARTLLSLNFRGDVMPRHNLSLRPALDPVASVCMAGGAAAIWAWRAHWRPHLALGAALALGLAPMVFSDGAPGFGRTLGAVPFVAMLPALGLVYVSTRLPHRTLAVVLAAGCLGTSASLSLYDYFVRYPRQPGLFEAFEVRLWTLIDQAQEASRVGTGYAILDEGALSHPASELAGRLADGDLRLINGQACLAYPAVTTVPTVIGVLPQWAPRLQGQFPHAASDIILHEPEVYPDGTVFRLPVGTASVASGAAVIAQLDDRFQLLSADLPAGPVRAGDEVVVFLRWRVLQPPAQALDYFVHVGLPLATPLAGADGEPCGHWYPTNHWHSDEIVEHEARVALSADLPKGTYPVFVGLYDWISGQRLTITQAGAVEPDRIRVGSLTIQ